MTELLKQIRIPVDESIARRTRSINLFLVSKKRAALFRTAPSNILEM